MNKKVLIIAPYPIANPQHGGQKRTKAIFDFYHSVFKEVRFVAVFHKKYFDDYDAGDLVIEDVTLISKIEDDPFLGDVLCGKALYDDASVKQKLIKLLEDYRPDVIQLEQGYAYEGLQPLLAELNINPKLILSSHNIEHRMKKEIYSSLDLPADKTKPLLEKIKQFEYALSKKSAVIITVSKADAQCYKSMGAKKCIVAPNGISRVVPTNAAVKHWRKFKRDQQVKHFVTFVGSAHPPNLTGFQEMIGEDLKFLPKDTRLMLAGGISQYMQETYKPGSSVSDSFWQKAVPLGKLSDDNLAGLIAESELLVLPITSGGGSNLKTAESILSGKKVIATPYAFRSYEQYVGLPNIQIADKKEEFRKQLVAMIGAPLLKRSDEQVNLANQVQWQYCLRPLSKVQMYVDGRVRFTMVRASNFLKRLISKILRLNR